MEKSKCQIESIPDQVQYTRFENYFSVKQILDDDTPPPDQIIGDGILLEQTFLLISGKKKVGKSMLAMKLKWLIKLSLPFLDMKNQKICLV